MRTLPLCGIPRWHHHDVFLEGGMINRSPPAAIERKKEAEPTTAFSTSGREVASLISR
jgi:hypothetical protein